MHSGIHNNPGYLFCHARAHEVPVHETIFFWEMVVSFCLRFPSSEYRQNITHSDLCAVHGKIP